MDVKIRMLFLVLVLGILYVMSKGILKVTQDVSQDVGHKLKGAVSGGSIEDATLTLDKANHLSKLPLKCIQNPLPYKAGVVIVDSSDLAMPQEHHPSFYGCFDWHSAVHGHWSLVYLMKEFPELEMSDSIRAIFDHNLSAENIQIEIDYFSINKYAKNFERTYGWAWLLKLSEELYTWDDEDANRWYRNLQPLNQLISEKYQMYLPKLVYPIRVGTHTNTAFGLGFAYDYAETVGDAVLKNLIAERAKEFYYEDKGCPITWEPSGYDFLSPCLEEIDIMRRVLTTEEFSNWKNTFLDGLKDGNLGIEPAEVRDRSDGHLVHLDGVNFSRAWCLYPLAKEYPELGILADQHYNHSIGKIVDGDYMGEHWLASFALYAMKNKQEFY